MRVISLSFVIKALSCSCCNGDAHSLLGRIHWGDLIRRSISLGSFYGVNAPDYLRMKCTAKFLRVCIVTPSFTFHGHLMCHLIRCCMNLADLRIVLEYEKAAIAATLTTFRESALQFCPCHLSLKWNRRRRLIGLKKFIFGDDNIPEITKCCGLIFLPKRSHCDVPCLERTECSIRLHSLRKMF